MQRGIQSVDAEGLVRLSEFADTMQRAAIKAQADSRARGIPVVHIINGQVYYELPSGEMTREEPEIYKQYRLKASQDK